MNATGKEWLKSREIFERGILTGCRTFRSVLNYIQRHQLSSDQEHCRKAPGEGPALVYHVSLFAPEIIERRRRNRKPAAPQTPQQTLSRTRSVLETNEWLTAREIFERGIIPGRRSLNSVQMYIKRHQLSSDQEHCRKAPGEGAALLYHVSLFAPEIIERRRRNRKPARRNKPSRARIILETAEDGHLYALITAIVATGGGTASIHVADDIRRECIDRFGPTVKIGREPPNHVRMPSTLAFFKLLVDGLSGKVDGRIVEAELKRRIHDRPRKVEPFDFHGWVKSLLSVRPDLTPNNVRAEYSEYIRLMNKKDRVRVPELAEFRRVMKLIQRERQAHHD